jgi:alkaline phosphatase
VASALCAFGVAVAHDWFRHDDGDRTDELRRELDGGRARNVILFIGDGMGDSEITIARNYHLGAAGRLNMDTLPLTGAYTTYAIEESDPSLPNYVTDSAASGTGWATGQKTSNGRISTQAGTITVACERSRLRGTDKHGHLRRLQESERWPGLYR